MTAFVRVDARTTDILTHGRICRQSAANTVGDARRLRKLAANLFQKTQMQNNISVTRMARITTCITLVCWGSAAFLALYGYAAPLALLVVGFLAFVLRTSVFVQPIQRDRH